MGFIDEDYKSQGVNIIEYEKELIQSSDIIIQLGLLSDDKLSYLKENQILIGVLNPFVNKEKLDILIKKKLIISHSNYYLELQELNLWIFYLHKQIWLVTKL